MTGPSTTAAAQDLACSAPACTEARGAATDLTWLLNRGAQRARAALDTVAREQGLNGARDWIVLAAIDEAPGRTQLALAQSLGLDKTTMTALLDRLEHDGLVLRSADPRDRRARIPALTAPGRTAHERFLRGRDEVEADLLAGFTDAEQKALRDLLTRLAFAEGPGPAEPGGSCM